MIHWVKKNKKVGHTLSNMKLMPKTIPFSGLKEGETNFAGKTKEEMDKIYSFKQFKGLAILNERFISQIPENLKSELNINDLGRASTSECLYPFSDTHGFYLYETDDVDILLIPYFLDNVENREPLAFEYHYHNRKTGEYCNEFVQDVTTHSVLEHLKAI